MDPILLGSIGLAAMFLLIALHVPIGVAMGVTGVVSVAFIIGWNSGYLRKNIFLFWPN